MTGLSLQMRGARRQRAEEMREGGMGRRRRAQGHDGRAGRGVGDEQQQIGSISELNSRLESGPFQVFMRALDYPGRSLDSPDDAVLRVYFLWRGREDSTDFQQAYYEELSDIAAAERALQENGAPADADKAPAARAVDYNSMEFRPWYLELKSRYKTERVKITPYFYWLGWYLKRHATPELLARSSFDIALELGAEWNNMDQSTKQRWAAIVSKESRHQPWRGKKDANLPEWYFDKFY